MCEKKLVSLIGDRYTAGFCDMISDKVVVPHRGAPTQNRLTFGTPLLAKTFSRNARSRNSGRKAWHERSVA